MNNKKKLYIILGIVGILLLGVLIFLAVTIYPKYRIGKEIADALQPVLEAENQSMHLDVAADINGEPLSLNTDIYLVKDTDIKYLVLEQEGHPVYVVDNILFLENGKAFKIADKMQSQVEEYESLLPQIMAVYKMFDITNVETDLETSYTVTVTGEQAESLLAAVIPTEYVSFAGIESLQMKLLTKEKQLDRVELSGSAGLDAASVQIAVTLSDFQVLDDGEYVIPQLIKESVVTVDKDSLFNLTEDLYRLLVALEPFSDVENIEGTVRLTADCGLLQIDTTKNLSEFKKNANSSEITNQSSNGAGDEITFQVDIQQVLEMIGSLCMEGDISCTESGDAYVYKLVLDAEFMKQLAENIAPEIVNYVVSLTEGSTKLVLEGERITAMEIIIKGDVSVIFTEVPMEIGAEFRFE